MSKVAFVVLCSLAAAMAMPPKLGRVMGGEIAEVGQFPFAASLQFDGHHYCGVTILDEYTVITVANCVLPNYPTRLKVVTGLNKISAGGEVHNIRTVLTHGRFAASLQYDIALLKLVTPITFNELAQPVKLPTGTTGSNADVTMSGWGSTVYPGNVVDDLRYIDLKTMDYEKCNNRQSFQVFFNQICTLTKAGEGLCSGDAGAPLTSPDGTLVGIASWGTMCAVGDPDVYTSIYHFLDWIETNRV
ncbi:PREDICTED: chymotrypsin-1-like [Nicrophorus vespilloides]|uniref:Chymotrypsin-1-like n=1 Tax=Nicrophorus vespilloides TaxID=110193 RepID=A0ABM1MNS1_NICVS|nr:PREDICTED: chymotrypsin-1-like [Nicrophorus vespilloides]